jgi:hypothetical protein
MVLSVAATKVEELLAILDADIQHLEGTLSHLDALRRLLVKRDDAGLRGLLEDIGRQAGAREENERKRQRLRAELAVTVPCEPGQLTLSRLQTVLPDPYRRACLERQNKLKGLMMDLKREHKVTALLVSDCARFNRSLMRVVFGLNGKDTVTYSPNGTVANHTNATLMSLNL